MAAEKAEALVLRTTDWSETSRIATMWTREFGKVRVLAKGGRRLKSNFESALDLLTLCSIVLLRKSSGSLDLLTEARVNERFPRLRTELRALYAAYYLAELLSDLTEDNDPHPLVFDEALAALRELGTPGLATGLRLARFELVFLRELGYGPSLENCAGCGMDVRPSEVADESAAAFSPAAGGVLCLSCRSRYRDCLSVSFEGRHALLALGEVGEAWHRGWSQPARAEVRQVLNHYVTYLMGRRPKMLAYLGS